MKSSEYLDSLLQSYITERDNLLGCISNNLTLINSLSSSLDSSKLSDQEFKFFSPLDRDDVILKIEEDQQNKIDELLSLNDTYEERIKELEIKISEFDDISLDVPSDENDSLICAYNYSNFFDCLSLLDSKYYSFIYNLYNNFVLELSSDLKGISSHIFSDQYRSDIEIKYSIKKIELFSDLMNKFIPFIIPYSGIDSFNILISSLKSVFTDIDFELDFDQNFNQKSLIVVYFIFRELVFLLFHSDFSFTYTRFHMKQYVKFFDIVIDIDSGLDDNIFIVNPLINSLFNICNVTCNISHLECNCSEIHIVVPIFCEVDDAN